MTSLRISYRITDRISTKLRPPWFSKKMALESLARSIEQSTGFDSINMVFVVDGDLPAGCSSIARSLGEVRVMKGGSNRRSFLNSVRVALDSSRLEEPDFIWMAEDDYLYQPSAMDALGEAERTVSEASYFTLYTPDDTEWHANHASQPGWTPPTWDIALTHQWHRVGWPTSTFGARRAALAEDYWLLRLCAYGGSPISHACGVALQGAKPYDLRHVARDLNLKPGGRAVANAALRVLMRPTINAAAHLQHRKRRILIAPVRDLATHMETGAMSADYDWAQLAAGMY